MMQKRFAGNLWIGRWQLLGIVLTCAVIIFATAVALYTIYVPGDSRETTGIIVSFETSASRSGPKVATILYVRLENGVVVSARADSSVTAKVGRPVKLIATQMPLIGIERFRFKEFNDPPVNANPLFQR
jgi:hypothetical protein